MIRSALIVACAVIVGNDGVSAAQLEVTPGIEVSSSDVLLAWQPPPPPPRRGPRGPRRPGPPPPPVPQPPPPLPESNLPRTDVYFFVSPGGASAGGHTEASFQAGAGVEEVLRHGLGLGVEASALGLSHSFGSSVGGVLSPNVYYHFRHRTVASLDPFVTGGYTAFIRNDVRNGLNVGAGLNYWFRPHTGLRVEVRDEIAPNGFALPEPRVANSSSTSQYWGIRIGLVF